MTTTKILERVRQLVALTASPNENEARNAAALACRLIRDHKLEIVDRDPKPGNVSPPPPSPPRRPSSPIDFEWVPIDFETMRRAMEDLLRDVGGPFPFDVDRPPRRPPAGHHPRCPLAHVPIPRGICSVCGGPDTDQERDPLGRTKADRDAAFDEYERRKATAPPRPPPNPFDAFDFSVGHTYAAPRRSTTFDPREELRKAEAEAARQKRRR